MDKAYDAQNEGQGAPVTNGTLIAAKNSCSTTHITYSRISLELYENCTYVTKGKDREVAKICRGAIAKKIAYPTDSTAPPKNTRSFMDSLSASLSSFKPSSDEKYGAILFDYIYHTKSEYSAEELETLESEALAARSMTLRQIYVACAEQKMNVLNNSDKAKMAQMLKAILSKDKKSIEKYESNPDDKVFLTTALLLTEDTEKCVGLSL
jgi:hypothetical protein